MIKRYALSGTGPIRGGWNRCRRSRWRTGQREGLLNEILPVPARDWEGRRRAAPRQQGSTKRRKGGGRGVHRKGSWWKSSRAGGLGQTEGGSQGCSGKGRCVKTVLRQIAKALNRYPLVSVVPCILKGLHPAFSGGIAVTQGQGISQLKSRYPHVWIFRVEPLPYGFGNQKGRHPNA